MTRPLRSNFPLWQAHQMTLASSSYCTVQYDQEASVIWCACHNGKFDLNGRVISGPPPRPLEPYQVNVRGDEVIVSKPA